MKNVIAIAIIAGVLWFGWVQWGRDMMTPKPHFGPEVHIGATVEDVEKVMGQPTRVLPEFGREMRMYKDPKTGETVSFMYQDGLLQEFHY